MNIQKLFGLLLKFLNLNVLSETRISGLPKISEKLIDLHRNCIIYWLGFY
jgi:hypothetical protein